MAEAWRVREIERKQLIKKLQEEFYELADTITPSPESVEETDAPFLEAAMCLLKELEDRRGPLAQQEGRLRLRAFCRRACIDIDDAARSPEEAAVLIADLAQELLENGLRSFYSKLQSQQMRNPQLIYHADSAMEDVLLPD